DQLQLPHLPAAQAPLRGQADVLQGQRIEAHELGGDRVDRHLVGTGQQDVGQVRPQGPRSGPSPEIVPSMTANSPGWISCWIASRSTRVSWITRWVQWRWSCSKPPKAFFIAP